MAKASPLVSPPPDRPQAGQVAGQQQRNKVKRWRWRWYRCKPLVALMWLLGGMVTVPMWIWIIK